MDLKSFHKSSPEAVRASRGKLRIQGVFRDPLGSHVSRFRLALGIPWGLLGVPLGNLFETCLLPGGPRTRPWMPFWLICFRMLFLDVFLWISETARTLKPWIPYGRGSKNHTFARTRFFTVSASILESFWNRKRTQNPVLAHFGGPCEHKSDEGLRFKFQCFFKIAFLRKSHTGLPNEVPQRRNGGRGLVVWGLGKTSHSEKRIAKP